MTNKVITKTARQLLDQHGFDYVTIKLSSAKTILGQAVFYRDGFGHSRPYILKLSTTLLSVLGYEQLVDTILHEIAHFKAGLAAGHGPAWKAACRAIGAKPERLASLDQRVAEDLRKKTSKYHLTCDDCGNVHYRNRLPRGRSSFAGYRCGKCHGPLTTEVKS